MAWHGNAYPYKYDLARFNAMNTVGFDHPDPSIFTVLTSPSDTAGTANVDFEIFPPRWMVPEHTLPPAVVPPQRDERVHGARARRVRREARRLRARRRQPAQCLAAHGPDRASHAPATAATLEPRYLGDTLAFMFESRCPFDPTGFAMKTPALDRNYDAAWDGFAGPALIPGPSPRRKGRKR